jgi:hypothetical protein
MGIQSCERSYTDHNKKGKGKLSVELNSSYSIDEVNVRFKTQNILDKDLMVISLETPVHPLEISSAAEAELQILSIQLDRILYQIEEIPTTVLRKNSTDNFSTSNYDGIIGSGYTTRTFH